MKKTKNKKGMSLVEVMFVVAIMAVIALVVGDIFMTIVTGQRRAIAAQNTQENMRYLFEILSKEIRHAQRSDNECFAAGTNRIFNKTTDASGNDIIYFKNKNDECVTYYVVDGAIMIRRGVRVALTTPDEVFVSNFTFDIKDNNINTPPENRVQPLVTIKMNAEASNQALDQGTIDMQTSISSRFYE